MGQSAPSTQATAPSRNFALSSCSSRKPISSLKSSCSTRKFEWSDAVKMPMQTTQYLNLLHESLKKCKDGKILFLYSANQHKDTPFRERLEQAQAKEKMMLEDWERRLIIRDSRNKVIKVADVGKETHWPIEVALQDSGVRDRTDLCSMHEPSLKDFVTLSPEQADLKKDLIITEEGHVEIVETAIMNPLMMTGQTDSKHNAKHIAFPTHATEVKAFGKDASFRVFILAGSEDGNVESKTQKVFKGDEKELRDVIYELLNAGADQFYLRIYREVLSVCYDKVVVIEERETETGTEMTEWPKCWVITDFDWMVGREYWFVPNEDPVLDLCNKVVIGELSKEKALNELQRRAPRREDSARFHAYLGEGASTNYERFIRQKAQFAPSRPYTVQVRDPKGYKTTLWEGIAADCLQHILKLVTEYGSNMAHWELFLAWEPIKLKCLEEYMHHIRQCHNRRKQEEGLEAAMKAVDLLNSQFKGLGERSKEAAAATGLGRRRKQAAVLDPLDAINFQEQDVGLLFASGRSMMDRVGQMHRDGVLTKDRFEEQFERVCTRMISFCKDVLMPQAVKTGNANFQIAISRTQADFMRLLIIHIPSFKDKEDDCIKIYNDCISKKKTVPPWNQAVFSCYVNAALFAAECLRSREEAVLLCRAGREYANETPYKAGDKHMLPSCSAIHTWNLLETNRRAFASWLMLLVITFDEESLQDHAELLAATMPEKPKEVLTASKSWNACGLSAAPDAHAMLTRMFSSQTSEELDKKEEAAKQQDDKEAARKAMPQRVVEKWLQGRPLHSCHSWEIERLKWVGEAEKYDGQLLEDTLTKGLTEHQRRQRQATGPIRVSLMMQQADRKKGLGEDDAEEALPSHGAVAEGRSFIIGVALLPRMHEDKDKWKTRTDGVGSRSIEDPNWSWSTELTESFKSRLKSWPREPHSESRRLDLRNVKPGDFKKLSEALDDDGVIMKVPGSEFSHCKHCNYEFHEQAPWCPECRRERPATFWRIAGLQLRPGDTLVQFGKDGYPLQKIRDGERPLVHQAISFIPSLKVESCEMLMRGNYADFNEHFKGWQDHTPLSFVPDAGHSGVKNYYDLARALRDARRLLKLPKVPTRRLRGLSARRDAAAAVSRGCP